MNTHTQTDISAYVSANNCRWRWWTQHNVVQTPTLEVLLLHDNSATSAHCAAASSAASHVIPTPVNTCGGVLAMVITDRNNGCCSSVYIQQIYQTPSKQFWTEQASRLCTPCLKKLCQLIFCSSSVKYYEPIAISIGGLSWNTHSTKLYLKCPFQLKYVLALPWEIRSVRLSHQLSN